MKIIIFGCGITARELLKVLDDSIMIQGFSDNNKDLHNKSFNGENVYPPEDIASLDFDYIVVASIFYNVIIKQLTEIVGIPREKILIFIGSRCPSDVPENNDEILSKMVRKTSDNKIGFVLSDNEENNKELLWLSQNVPDYILDDYEIECFNYKHKSDCGIVIHQDLECMPNYLVAKNIALWKGVSFKEISQIRDIPEDYILEGAYIHGVSLILFKGDNLNGYPVVSWDMMKDELFVLGIPEVNDTKGSEQNKTDDVRKAIYIPSPFYRLNSELPVMDCEYAKSAIMDIINLNDRFKSLNIKMIISLPESEAITYINEKYSNINFISQDSVEFVDECKSADVIITDNSISNFQFTISGRKVIHFVLKNDGYNEPKKYSIKGDDCLHLAQTVNRVEDMFESLVDLLDNDDIYYKNRTAVEKNLIYNNESDVCEILWNEISRYLKNK